jgi:hypothetical protein
MSEATGIALATNRDERRRNSLRVAIRAAVLVLTLVTMTLTTAAWADQATATTNSQSGPTTMTRTGPTATTTRTGPTATTTRTGPTATTRSSTIPNPLPRSIPVNDSGFGDNPAAGTNNSTVQGPSSDAGLDGTAARTSGGLVWLLLPAGLLLIALAAWLRLRQATARRRW